MGESRQDILSWVNNLLSLNITRIEELGKGYALCQVFDSIYLDVPLKRVKFNCNQEFEYLHNWKILQAVFQKHKIQNAIPIERLVKLKFQDNIEFVQFVKKYWDSHFPGHPYDGVARRSGAEPSRAVETAVKRKPVVASTASLNGTMAKEPRHVLPTGRASSTKELETQLSGALEQLITLEKERDFYYNKLRIVEVAMQKAQEEERPIKPQDVLSVLYSTEEGFEMPNDNAVAAEM